MKLGHPGVGVGGGDLNYRHPSSNLLPLPSSGSQNLQDLTGQRPEIRSHVWGSNCVGIAISVLSVGFWLLYLCLFFLNCDHSLLNDIFVHAHNSLA